MCGIGDIIRAAVVVIMFGLILGSSYYFNDQFELPAIVTGLMPAGTVNGWNDKTIALPDVTHSAGMWQGSQVLAGELEATEWVNDHTLKTDKFVADIGGAECIMGMTTRVSLVGGDWANCPDPVHNMELAGRIYSTTDAMDAHDMAWNAGYTYVWVPNRQVNTGTYDNIISKSKFENPTFFQLVYSNEDVSIYRVLP